MSSFRHYNVNNEEQVPSLSTGADVELGKFIPKLQESLKINIIKLNDEEIVFDLIGSPYITHYYSQLIAHDYLLMSQVSMHQSRMH